MVSLRKKSRVYYEHASIASSTHRLSILRSSAWLNISMYAVAAIDGIASVLRGNTAPRSVPPAPICVSLSTRTSRSLVLKWSPGDAGHADSRESKKGGNIARTAAVASLPVAGNVPSSSSATLMHPRRRMDRATAHALQVVEMVPRDGGDPVAAVRRCMEAIRSRNKGGSGNGRVSAKAIRSTVHLPVDLSHAPDAQDALAKAASKSGQDPSAVGGAGGKRKKGVDMWVASLPDTYRQHAGASAASGGEHSSSSCSSPNAAAGASTPHRSLAATESSDDRIFELNMPSSERCIAISGLISGRQYAVRVIEKNAVGFGTPSKCFGPFATLAPPSFALAPPVIAERGTDFVLLRWPPLPSLQPIENQAPVSGFQLRIKEFAAAGVGGGGSSPAPAMAATLPPGPSHLSDEPVKITVGDIPGGWLASKARVSSLKAGTRHTFEIRARSDAGPGPWCPVASAAATLAPLSQPGPGLQLVSWLGAGLQSAEAGSASGEELIGLQSGVGDSVGELTVRWPIQEALEGEAPIGGYIVTLRPRRTAGGVAGYGSRTHSTGGRGSPSSDDARPSMDAVSPGALHNDADAADR